MSIAIATPYGNIGGRITRHLLDAGEDLILLPHDASKLDEAVRDRATVRPVSLEDADGVAEATRGADALFWLSPHGMHTPSLRGWYETLGRSATHAIRENGISHVVNLSSQGAHQSEGLGPVSGLARVEELIDESDAAVVHLRPGFFMENFFAQLDAIRDAGALFFPTSPDTETAMIATRDIADVAADLLRDRSWSGRRVLGLHGPRDYTYNEAAGVLADVLDREVRVQQVPVEGVVGQFKGYGASDDWARGMAELYSRIGDPEYYADTEPRTGETTTPTTLRAFAEQALRPALNA